MWDLIFPKTPAWNITRSKKSTVRHYEKKLRMTLCKEHIILVWPESTGIFLTDFLKNPQISNIIKTHSVGAELLHAERWTAGQAWQIIVAFQNFSNTPKKDHIHFITVRMLAPYRANEPNKSPHLRTTEQTPILPSCSKFYLSVIFMRLQWQSVSQLSPSLYKNKMHTFLISNKKWGLVKSDIQQ